MKFPKDASVFPIIWHKVPSSARAHRVFHVLQSVHVLTLEFHQHPLLLINDVQYKYWFYLQ